jgi:alpha,alpha-trehalase
MVLKKTYSVSIQATDFDAVIFDLDGAIMDTASVHASAWKKVFDDLFAEYDPGQGVCLQPFEIKTDYHIYMDGKPLLKGLKSFLESRGINIPEGEPKDLAGKKTIYGLAKQKDKNFLEHIQKLGVEIYGSMVDLIHCIKKNGLKTAVISSSKRCAVILDCVNLSNFFDVRVDGVDLEILGIPGKPAPDIFLEATRQLKVKPEQAAVIEDTVSGIQAARAGKFGLIIGIARADKKATLIKNGANVVVKDLNEISVADDFKNMEKLTSALDCFEEISSQAQGKRLTVFLDYDGTLSPIAETPDQAVMEEDMKKALIELSQHCPVGIISGRDLKNIQYKVKIDSIIYAGSHGFDICGPKELEIENVIGEEFIPILDKAEKEVSLKLKSIQGLLVERKKFAIAIHYRRVDPEKIEEVEAAVDEITAKYSELRKSYGKKIFELQPQMDWHKGKALFFLLNALKLDREDVLPFYIGDDVTDEDAFRALRGRGIGIVVREHAYETAAAYSLKNPDEVREFLLKLVSLCQSSS